MEHARASVKNASDTGFFYGRVNVDGNLIEYGPYTRPDVEIGQVYAWRGDKDRSIEWLQRAVAQHEEMQQLKVDPLLRHLLGDQRYTALLKQVNLPVD